jgi:hypothetical protein
MTDRIRIARLRQEIIAVVTRALHVWLDGDDVDAGAVHSKIDRILERALAEERARVGGAS